MFIDAVTQEKNTKNTEQVYANVRPVKAPPVLGLKACLDFRLIKLILSGAPEVSILDEFADVFTGIGLFPGECTIHLDPNAPPRRVPIAIWDRVK